MNKAIRLGATIVLAALAATGARAADSGSAPRPSCFSSRDFENWKAPDASTILIRVRSNRFYRLDLAGKCQELLFPGAYLVTKFQGSNYICSALDWDLHVRQTGVGGSVGCIVKNMTELSPAEVAAIPPKFKP